jgi:hypothetical protein
MVEYYRVPPAIEIGAELTIRMQECQSLDDNPELITVFGHNGLFPQVIIVSPRNKPARCGLSRQRGC